MMLLDLFAGIGGFSYAAHQMGWSTAAFVEKDAYCQAVLKKNFPNVPIFGDIKQFNGKDYTGAIDLVCGGFPCQPFSHAGKRKGTDDDRFLWYEMLRVIRETRPAWVVGENVAGLLSMGGGSVLDDILTDLENEGYTTETFTIPACAVQAPHERDRVWIIAHASERRRRQTYPNKYVCRGQSDTNRGYSSANANTSNARLQGSQQRRTLEQREGTSRPTTEFYSDATDANDRGEQHLPGNDHAKYPNIAHYNCNATNTESKQDKREGTPGFQSITTQFNWSTHWYEVATQLCRVDDGVSARLDEAGDVPGATKKKKSAGRAHRLKALGNAIVPAVALEIFKAIDRVEQSLF